MQLGELDGTDLATFESLKALKVCLNLQMEGSAGLGQGTY